MVCLIGVAGIDVVSTSSSRVCELSLNFGQTSDVPSEPHHGMNSWNASASCSFNPTLSDIYLFEDEGCITLDLLIMSSIPSSITCYNSKDPRRRKTPLQIRHPAAGWTSKGTER